MQGMGTGMKKPLPKHQKVEYRRNEPFFVANVRCGDSDYVYIKNSHWHEDLEIAYVVKGGGIHYIDGSMWMLQSIRIRMRSPVSCCW